MPCPSPRGLPNLGNEPKSSALAGWFFTTEPPGKSTKQPIGLPTPNLYSLLKMLLFFVDEVIHSLRRQSDHFSESQSQEDPLEKEMGTHSSILAWRIPWTEEPGGLQLMGSQKSHPHTLLTVIIFLVVV